ncbi:cohesin domain-containing protein [Candidatus Latescibacterota bacterium]
MRKPGIYKINNILKVTMTLLICLLVVTGCKWVTSPSDDKQDVFSIRFYPSNVEIEENEEIDVYIWVDDARNLIAARFTISFDPSVVEVTEIQTSGIDFIFLDADANVLEMENSFDNDKGIVVVGIGALKEGFTGANGSGSLASITFKSKRIGKSDLIFINTEKDDLITTAYSSSDPRGWVDVSSVISDGSVVVREHVEESTDGQQTE